MLLKKMNVYFKFTVSFKKKKLEMKIFLIHINLVLSIYQLINCLGT
jgi:hypothetical protein